MVLEGRLSAEDAARLLDALIVLEESGAECEREVVEPPCRPPSWREAGDDSLALLNANRLTALRSAATQEIVDGLRTADRGTMARPLAVLDLPELGNNEPIRRPLTMAGGVELREKDGMLRMGSVNLVTGWTTSVEADLPLTHWILLACPLPFEWPQAPRQWETEVDGIKRHHATRPEPVSLQTAMGSFPDCLQVTSESIDTNDLTAEALESVSMGADEDALTGVFRDEAKAGGRIKTWTLWLAKGIGPVRVQCVHYNGDESFIDLIDASPLSGDRYFPLDPGRWWRFEGRGPQQVYREAWRTFYPEPDGDVWLSTSARLLVHS